MSRDELIEKVESLITYSPFGASERDDAERVLDAILPQVTTVEELGSLPLTTLLIGQDGSAFETTTNSLMSLLCRRSMRVEEHAGCCLQSGYVMNMYGPLTIVWQP